MTGGGPPGFPRLPPEGSPGLRRRKPDARNQTFGRISHASGPKLTFWGNFQMILHGFAWRSSKNTVLRSKTLKFVKESTNHITNLKNYVTYRFSCSFLVRVTLGLSYERVDPCGFDWRSRRDLVESGVILSHGSVWSRNVQCLTTRDP